MLNILKIKILHVSIFLSCLSLFSQSEPPEVTALGDQIYCPQTQQNIVTDFNITDSDSDSTSGFYIQISTGYVLGEDQLLLLGSHPNINSQWNAAEAKLSLLPSAGSSVLYSDIIDAVYDVVFFSNNINVSSKTFSLTAGEANFLNGHYYEFVPSQAIPWTAAKAIAEGMNYLGLQGYLATITSAAEAQLCGELSPGTGWIGGSDAQNEGVWKWVTGPEEGTVFWNGGVNGSAPAGMYSNWNNGEPNNSNNNEDYAHITDPSVGFAGSWNDLPNSTSGQPPQYTATGFVVEYGGMPGDPDLNISASTYFNPPEILTTTPGSGCQNQMITLEATSNTTDIIWFDSQFGGIQLNIGNSYSVELITDTTFWVLASENNCSNGLRVPVDATITDSESSNFTQIEDICQGTELTLPTTSNNGITGVWSPQFDPNNTTAYTFEPDEGQCASTAEMTVTVIPFTNPEFTQIDDTCEGTELTLPTTSNNGITGVWSPQFDPNNTTAYTFEPDEGQCASTAEMTVVIIPSIIPEFTQIDPLCAGDNPPELPLISNNGIEGTWNPNIINNLETTTYTFTPSEGSCIETAAMTITINELTIPSFSLNDICIGETIQALPTISNEGIIGTWFPAPNNLTTTTYTFTPENGQCANITTETIEVNSFSNLEITVENISEAFDSNQIIEISAVGGSGNYEYQLDGGAWQNSSIFQNVTGCYEHIVKVRDSDGCSNEPESSITILDYPKFFTPNGDGYNDFWNIKCLEYQTAIISVFNRHGKLLRELKTTSPGWNGTYNGKLLPTNDYWFVVTYFDDQGNTKQFRSHFTLRR